LVVRGSQVLRKPALAYGFAALALSCLIAVTRIQSGAFAGPLELWQMVLRRNPQAWMAHVNLGNYYVTQGWLDEALLQYEKSAKIKPDNGDVHNNIANILLAKGQDQEAESHFKAALEAKPRDYKIHKNYAAFLKDQGRNGEALVHNYYPLVMEPEEKDWGRLVDLAWLLAASPDSSLRCGQLAVQMAEKANRLSRDSNPQVLQTLAAAYAEVGEFDKAVASAERALALAGKGPLADAIKEQKACYEAKQPFHSLTPIPQKLPPKDSGAPPAGNANR
jgi:Flp pilus assembly protein TadD